MFLKSLERHFFARLISSHPNQLHVPVGLRAWKLCGGVVKKGCEKQETGKRESLRGNLYKSESLRRGILNFLKVLSNN